MRAMHVPVDDLWTSLGRAWGAKNAVVLCGNLGTRAVPVHNSDDVIHILLHIQFSVSYAVLCAFPHHPQPL